MGNPQAVPMIRNDHTLDRPDFRVSAEEVEVATAPLARHVQRSAAARSQPAEHRTAVVLVVAKPVFDFRVVFGFRVGLGFWVVVVR